jgi:hypothetical protein
MSTVTRVEVLSFRQHLQNRIVGGEIEIDTANKMIGHVAGMFSTINEVNQCGLPAVFAKARISGGKDKQRVAFDPDFVRKRILANGLFDDLNDEARGIIYLVAEIGLRPVEACNLNRAATDTLISAPRRPSPLDRFGTSNGYDLSGWNWVVTLGQPISAFSAKRTSPRLRLPGASRASLSAC